MTVINPECALKVLIFSSKEMYDKSSYHGRAEAHVIAYRDQSERAKNYGWAPEDSFYFDEYVITKNRHYNKLRYQPGDRVNRGMFEADLRILENDLFREYMITSTSQR